MAVLESRRLKSPLSIAGVLEKGAIARQGGRADIRCPAGEVGTGLARDSRRPHRSSGAPPGVDPLATPSRVSAAAARIPSATGVWIA